MKTYTYQNNQLTIEQVKIAQIAEQVATPFYCYSQSMIQQAYQNYDYHLQQLDSLICYAVKANSNQAVIKILADLGAGADVVSEGELRRVLKAGIAANKIVYSGVGKTKQEIEFALNAHIYQFNVESENELELLNHIACKMNKKAAIAFRINPDVDAITHAKISTGKSENKFGIPIGKAREVYKKASQLPGIIVQGVDVHIGSQLTALSPFQHAFNRIKQLITDLKNDGINIKVIDVGGGLGINYENKDKISHKIKDYCAIVSNTFNDLNCKIILEPGRSLVGESGLLVSRVIYIKQAEALKFLIIDAAMNDLLRPSMYDAYHDILSVVQNEQQTSYDIVGPVCETGDTFARQRTISEMKEGQLLAITCTGAYGAVMASTYNTRLMIPEVLVHDDSFSVIKNRSSYDDLINQDQIAPWQV